MNVRFSVAQIAVFLIALLASTTGAQESVEVPFEITGRTMGPIKYKVVIAHHPATITPEQLQADVQATLDRVNGLMSTYIPESDVSRFNDSTSVDFIEVESETAKVVSRAIQISQHTNGAFDITVGPAVRLWNFGPDKKRFKPPADFEVADIKPIIGYEKISVRMNPPSIRKSHPKLHIDLSAIAKGHAVDEVASTLKQAGCLQFMVEVGGEVTTVGERFQGGPWRIGVEKPTANKSDPTGELRSIALVKDQAMATSGDYRNFEKFEGKRYSHTIDPTTCRPVTHTVASASVIAPDCMTADAMATAIMVLGSERGAEVCNDLNLEYLITSRDSDFGTTFRDNVSDGFPLLKEDSKQGSNVGASILPTFIAAALVFGLVVLAMAVGSIFANKPVTGSCGGLANTTDANGDTTCGVCSQPTTDCAETQPNLPTPDSMQA